MGFLDLGHASDFDGPVRRRAEPSVIMANIAASDLKIVGRLPIFSGLSGESLAVLLAGARVAKFGAGDPWM